MKNKWLFVLIALDITWAGIALAYDWPKLADYPLYIWPAVIICPLYPALLAYIWYKIAMRKRPNNFVLTLATVGSAFFGLLAPVFYSLVMLSEGFNFLTFGAIFWVAFYGTQGWLLLAKSISVLKAYWLILVTILLTIKITLDWRYATFDYFTEGRPAYLNAAVFSAYAILTLLTVFIIIRRRLTRLNKPHRPHELSR